MPRIQKGGRKKDETRDRYPGGRPTPIDNDFGTLDQRLKRQVATGLRCVGDANALAKVFDKLEPEIVDSKI